MTPPRRFTWEEFPPTLVEALTPRVTRLGYLGEFFACAAHQPEALLAFIAFTESAKGGLDKALIEVIALTCAGEMGNDYERNQHEQLCLKLGFERAWVAAVNALEPDAPGPMTALERNLQRFVLTALRSNGKSAGAPFDALATELGDAGAMAVLMVIGRYAMHALIVNTLALRPPVASIFEPAPAA
jgi:alkylhydroperoxidase family enzyme